MLWEKCAFAGIDVFVPIAATRTLIKMAMKHNHRAIGRVGMIRKLSDYKLHIQCETAKSFMSIMQNATNGIFPFPVIKLHICMHT